MCTEIILKNGAKTTLESSQYYLPELVGYKYKSVYRVEIAIMHLLQKRQYSMGLSVCFESPLDYSLTLFLCKLLNSQGLCTISKHMFPGTHWHIVLLLE
jgi:hypothetical protein